MLRYLLKWLAKLYGKLKTIYRNRGGEALPCIGLIVCIILLGFCEINLILETYTFINDCSQTRQRKMNIEINKIANIEVAEVISDDIIINKSEDGIDLLGNLYYQGFDKVLIYEKNITPDFFELKTGIAGEILQKFSNYRVRLSIVGDFSKYTSKSLHQFIYESNKAGHVNFITSKEEALKILSNR